MYNGIGLQTPRGSGTNGHVQRNWALVRKTKDKVNYRTEEEIAKLDSASNKQPNKEILDHERKRKIEVKCAELEETLEQEGLSREEVQRRVAQYREKIQVAGSGEIPRDEFGRPAVRESHAIAEAQREKNARLRDAFGISDQFVDGSSLDPARRRERAERERAERVERVERERTERAERLEREKAEREERARYDLVRTPSHERSDTDDHIVVQSKKKKKHSVSPDGRLEKKKKSKKNRKEKDEPAKKKKKKRSKSTDSSSSDSSSDSSSESSDSDKPKRKRKKKRTAKKKAQSDDDSSEVESPSQNLAKKLKKPPEQISQTEIKSKKSNRQEREDNNDWDIKSKDTADKTTKSQKRSERSRSMSEDILNHKRHNSRHKEKGRSSRTRDDSRPRRTPSKTPERKRGNQSQSPRDRKRRSPPHVSGDRKYRSDYYSSHDRSDSNRRRKDKYRDENLSKEGRRENHDSPALSSLSRFERRNGSSPSKESHKAISPSKERRRPDSPPPKRRNLDDRNSNDRFDDRKKSRKDKEYQSPEPRYYSGNYKDHSHDRDKQSPRVSRNQSPAERKNKETKLTPREGRKEVPSGSNKVKEKLSDNNHLKDKRTESSSHKPKKGENEKLNHKKNDFVKSSSRELTPEIKAKPITNQRRNEISPTKNSIENDKSTSNTSNKSRHDHIVMQSISKDLNTSQKTTPWGSKYTKSSPFVNDQKLSPDKSPINKEKTIDEVSKNSKSTEAKIQIKISSTSVDQIKSRVKKSESPKHVYTNEVLKKTSELSQVQQVSTSNKSANRTRKLSTPISVRDKIEIKDKTSSNKNVDKSINSRSKSQQRSRSKSHSKKSRSRSRSDKGSRPVRSLQSPKSRSRSRNKSKSRSRSRSKSHKSFKSGRSHASAKSRSQSRDSLRRANSRSHKMVKSKSRSPVNARSRSRSRNSSSLSYSPARRSPERYREIIEQLPEKDKSKYIKSPSALEPKKKSEGNIKVLVPFPVVRLRSSSSENDYGFDEFPPMYEETQEELEIKELAELTAKAKESVKKKKLSGNRAQNRPGHSTASAVPLSAVHFLKSKKPENNIAMELTESSKASSPTELSKSEGEIQEKDNRNETRSRSRSASSARSRRTHSRSRTRSRSRSSSTSSSSRHSRSSRSSSSYSRSSSRSRSSRSSNSSGSSRTSRSRSRSGSRSRSPSIPRRAGSPSFLDRRRITRKKHRRSASRSEDSSSASSSD